MKLSKEKPPIYEACAKKFGVNWKRGIIFTYGDTVHCRNTPSDQKLAHEQIHVNQQLSYGVKEWWSRYLEDVEFRLSQEVEAYRAEYKWIKKNVKSYLQREKINQIVSDLSGYIYGNIVSSEEARNLITS